MPRKSQEESISSLKKPGPCFDKLSMSGKMLAAQRIPLTLN